MAKKKEEIEAVAVEVKSPFVGISEVTTDFGRADLNELAAKLNEVIRKIN